MGLGPVGIGGDVIHGLPDVGLVQQNAVHIDAVALIVNVHRLSAGGNDALNDSYAAQVLHRGLVEHHDVPLLRLIAQRPNQQELLVLKSIGHGLPLHPGQPPNKGEYQHQAHQGGGQGVEPVKQILRGLFFPSSPARRRPSGQPPPPGVRSGAPGAGGSCSNSSAIGQPPLGVCQHYTRSGGKMQPLGVIPAPGRPGHIRRRTAGDTGPHRGGPQDASGVLPVGGVQSGPAVSPLLEEDAQLDAVRGSCSSTSPVRS